MTENSPATLIHLAALFHFDLNGAHTSHKILTITQVGQRCRLFQLARFSRFQFSLTDPRLPVNENIVAVRIRTRTIVFSKFFIITGYKTTENIHFWNTCFVTIRLQFKLQLVVTFSFRFYISKISIVVVHEMFDKNAYNWFSLSVTVTFTIVNC